MTIVLTELARKASIGSGIAWTSPSFAVAAGADVWVAVMGDRVSDWTVESNTGGLTFSQVSDAGPFGAFNYHSGLDKATNSGGAIGSMTLTVSAPTGSSDGYDACVFQIAYSGTLSVVQSVADTGSAGEPCVIGDLGSAVTSTNTALLVFGMNEDNAGGGPSFAVSGWNTVTINSWASENFYYGINVVARTGFTGTNVSVADYAASPTWGMGHLVELAESGGGPSEPPMLRGVTRSGLTLR